LQLFVFSTAPQTTLSIPGPQGRLLRAAIACSLVLQFDKKNAAWLDAFQAPMLRCSLSPSVAAVGCLVSVLLHERLDVESVLEGMLNGSHPADPEALAKQLKAVASHSSFVPPAHSILVATIHEIHRLTAVGKIQSLIALAM
jgi:hypothetical protein